MDYLSGTCLLLSHNTTIQIYILHYGGNTSRCRHFAGSGYSGRDFLLKKFSVESAGGRFLVCVRQIIPPPSCRTERFGASRSLGRNNFSTVPSVCQTSMTGGICLGRYST
ncbi:uncharacterized protein CIMG_12712 [Coccidioides immitis RS]|uniref:Uncharacterized protein n=1 Tax=Coccidioides immitis (strain RS) TaxID=246410 RepID=A0A0D8JRY7_COCIM|nr:uncharacterized protein CIMG_12712 [Coccidioides immitis RS]KJF60057.1 hypothetical protein CIMG_12712 [Coccidioides immitis RS]